MVRFFNQSFGSVGPRVLGEELVLMDGFSEKHVKGSKYYIIYMVFQNKAVKYLMK